VLDVLLAVGLVLSTASQLRPAGIPVGIGELCLAAWVLLMLSREAVRLGPPLRMPLSRLLTFWTAFAVALCVGTMTGFAIGDRHDTGLFLHDVVAYLLVAAVSCLSVVEPGAGARLRRVAWLSATLGAAWLALQVAFGWELIDSGNLETWEWDRFRGFTGNSNQLALFCTVISIVSLHLADSAGRPGERIVALICMTVAILVGRLTKSDAFLLVLIVGGPLFVALKLWRWLMSPARRLSLRSAFAWILALALPLTVAYAAPLGVIIQLDEIIMGMTKGGGGRDTNETARLRFELWDGAVRRGIEAGMLGLGPGPHLAMPPSIVVGRRDSTNEPKDVDRPEVSSVPNFEAHNTVLDLFVQGGLMAVLSLGWLAAAALIVTYRAGLDALTTLLCGLAIFSVFHLIVRHPIFWFAIAICLVASRRRPLVRS
jgi:O-antigen ligase